MDYVAMVGEQWIDTWSGRRFTPLHPRSEDVAIEDIAASLANQCRFAGHSREFYSVGQHSVHVAELLLHHDAEVAMWGLLHDSAEAYLLDIPRPIKISVAMRGYREAEGRILQAIARAFCLPHRVPSAVREADEVLLVTEARDLMTPRMRLDLGRSVEPLAAQIIPWQPSIARARFLELFEKLQSQRGPAHHTWMPPSCPLVS